VAVLEHARREGKGPFLVIAPLTTLTHWQREIQKWYAPVRCMERLCARMLPRSLILTQLFPSAQDGHERGGV
jgi:hypothetical protein